jgi:hypothetical protein
LVLLISILSKTRNTYTVRMDELTLAGKTYVSSKRAAEITGYAKDYVGQLCREGHVVAKMVGRSWYVLESSIREHRFGPQEGSAADNALQELDTEAVFSREEIARPVLDAEKDAEPAWAPATYAPETAQPLPPVEPKPVYVPKTVPDEANEAISDMQAAWKEWFEHKQTNLPAREEEVLLESPEIIESRAHEDAYEEIETLPSHFSEETVTEDHEEEAQIPLHRIETDVEPELSDADAVVVPIRTIRNDGVTPQRAVQRPTRASRRAVRSEKKGSNVVTKALLVAVALFAIAIGIVGSGRADQYAEKNPLFQYLGGTRTINKQ